MPLLIVPSVYGFLPEVFLPIFEGNQDCMLLCSSEPLLNLCGF